MSINKNKISVIVPVFNGERFIKKCLESILSQDYLNFDIIVVDNNSNDKTKDIIEEFFSKNLKITYIFEKKRGRGAARNTGVLAARGDLIAMTDADCVVPKNWLSSISLPIFKKLTQVVVGFQEEAVSNYWTKMRQLDDYNFLKNNLKEGFLDHLDTKNFIIEAGVIKKILFDEELKSFEDWDFFIKLKKENIKIYFLPDIKVLHFHDSSFKELFYTQVSRAYFASLIINKYKKDTWFKNNFRDNAIFLSIRPRNFLLFIPWSVYQFFIKPKKAPYLVLADLFWKIGVIFYFLNKNQSPRLKRRLF